MENNLQSVSQKSHKILANLSTISDIQQLDGNQSLDITVEQHEKIPVIVTNRIIKQEKEECRITVRKTIKRNNLLMQSMELPTVININPRSIYNKCEEFSTLVEQYEADLICMSESWDRTDYKLEELIQIENYRVFSNVKQRSMKGGKPAIIVNEDKFLVRPLYPEPITVPVNVEAVWCLLIPKNRSVKSTVKYIAVCAIYYSGTKLTKKSDLYDHLADSYNHLSTIYQTGLHFIIAGDTNRLDLRPILNLSPQLIQVVKVPTRLNPPAILDPIITTLSSFYNQPVTKPPIQNDADKNGKPSDHLVVLMRPLSSSLEVQPRKYRTVKFRPLPQSGIDKMKKWIQYHDWDDFYKCKGANEKAEILQKVLRDKFEAFFPEKSFKVCGEDKPWITKEVKKLDRSRKREFSRHGKTKKWEKLNEKFEEKSLREKENYYSNIVQDLKTSNQGQWYSKLKRMSESENKKQSNICVDEISHHSNQTQAEMIADHYTQISNQYKPLENADIPGELYNPASLPPYVAPYKVHRAIKSMNRKSATLSDDIPMKLINLLGYELSFPLSHLINTCLLEGSHPEIFKTEIVTPAPKVHPPSKMKDLRKISGLKNLSKVMEKVIAEFLIEDMKPSRDAAQYGNERGVSVQHYLIRMLHNILVATDKNSQAEKFAVILSLIDWSQAFDRQSHQLGILSSIENGVRSSVIPYLISYFQKRKMVVKWNECFSSLRNLHGGGPQGGTFGNLKYLSQTNKNT